MPGAACSRRSIGVAAGSRPATRRSLTKVRVRPGPAQGRDAVGRALWHGLGHYTPRGRFGTALRSPILRCSSASRAKPGGAARATERPKADGGTQMVKDAPPNRAAHVSIATPRTRQARQGWHFARRGCAEANGETHGAAFAIPGPRLCPGAVRAIRRVLENYRVEFYRRCLPGRRGSRLRRDRAAACLGRRSGPSMYRSS